MARFCNGVSKHVRLILSLTLAVAAVLVAMGTGAAAPFPRGIVPIHIHPILPPGATHPGGGIIVRPHPTTFPRVMPRPIRTATPAPPGGGSIDARWVSDATLRRPANAPKLAQFLVRAGPGKYRVRMMRPARLTMATSGHMRPMAANGNTIILTGDQSNFFANDITLEYGADVYLACQNMTGRHNGYRYVVFPPDGSAARIQNIPRTANNGDCTGYSNFNLSTPWGGFNGGTTTNGNAYPGVWVVAIQDTGTAGRPYVTEIAIVADAAVNFTTYANLGLTTPTNDFVPGSSIVVNATGLNPSHDYALGWVLTGGSGLPCEFTIPGPATAANGECFRGATTGLQAFGGQLTQFWGPSSSPSTSSAPTGTYDVQLYDSTASTLIGHQQISIEPSSVAWTLVPYNSNGDALPPGFNYNNIFSTDGLTDQSVTGITYSATGLPAASNGDTLRLSISDGNGVVLTNLNSYPIPNPPIMDANPTVRQAGGAVSSQQAFPLNTQYETALGPSQTPFAPNVLTAQLYDTAKGTILASKSFQLLSYAANAAWSSGVVLSAANTGTTATVVVTNTGDKNFGTWNGDAISGVQIASVPTDGETLALSSSSAVDSAGNTWTITTTGTGTNTVIVATPNARNTGIPVGGTLQFQITVTVPSGDCTTTCSLPTQILPEHGIAYSAADTASNDLQVLASGIDPATAVPTLSWAVQSEANTANMAARAATFGHLLYILGTANSPSSDSYNVALTLDNAVSAGGNNLVEVKLTFPAAVDLNANPPTIATSPGYGNWRVLTNTSGALAGAGQNVMALACRENSPNACGIPQGRSGTFVLSIPLNDITTSFSETNIAALANFDRGRAYNGGCGGCNMASYSLSGTQTTVNGIAGQVNTGSAMLGAFSLDPNLMTAVFTPSTVGTGTATSATLTYTNTAISRDPNPDYVDQLNLVFPAAANPASITVPSGWVATQTATARWRIALCTNPTNATPCSANETGAIAPGGQLSVTLKYNAPGPAAGTYNVTWYATGANGGEDTSAIATTTPITFSSTTGAVAFTSINGAPVTNGTEPQVGTDAVYPTGSTFVYTIDNTGSTNITGAVITIPNKTRSGSNANDGATNSTPVAGYMHITAVTLAYAGGAKSCTATYADPSAGGNGNITLTGCTIPANAGIVNITFTAQTPYVVGQELVFPALIKDGGTTVNAQSLYTASNVLSIVLNGSLTILTPAAGWIAPTQPNSVTPATGSGANPQTSCLSCQVTGGSPSTIDFGIFSGTFTTTDLVDASVHSDANSPNSWVLYVTTSPGSNPSNMLSTSVDAAHSSAPGGFTVNTGAFTAVSNGTPGTQLDTYTGSPYHKPIDSIMNYRVTTGGNVSPQSVTLTYTLIFN